MNNKNVDINIGTIEEEIHIPKAVEILSKKGQFEDKLKEVMTEKMDMKNRVFFYKEENYPIIKIYK